MSEILTIIHYSVTAITAITALVLTYMKYKGDNTTKQDEKESVCLAEFQELKIKVAVLESRQDNEIKQLDKLDTKLDEIRSLI